MLEVDVEMGPPGEEPDEEFAEELGDVCEFVVISEEVDWVEELELVDAISELADRVLELALVAIEIRVELDSWQTPIQQLYSMSTWRI